MSIAFEVRISDGISDTLTELNNKASNLDELFADFGERMVRSVTKNFSAEGRPSKWKKSQKESGKTLTGATKRLKKVFYNVRGDSVVISTQNLPYAALHQFGGEIKPGAGKKYLAIPLTRAARLSRPSEFENTFVRKSKKGGLFIFQVAGKKKIKALYKLQKSVKIDARPYMLIQQEDRLYFEKKINTYFKVN